MACTRSTTWATNSSGRWTGGGSARRPRRRARSRPRRTSTSPPARPSGSARRGWRPAPRPSRRPSSAATRLSVRIAGRSARSSSGSERYDLERGSGRTSPGCSTSTASPRGRTNTSHRAHRSSVPPGASSASSISARRASIGRHPRVEDGLDQPGTGPEVVLHRRVVALAGLGGDLAQRQRTEALLGDEALGRVDHRPAGTVSPPFGRHGGDLTAASGTGLRAGPFV